jgi:hypothetical protein
VDPKTHDLIVQALQGLARANAHDFSEDARLCARFFRRLKEKRFRYTADRVTCGFLDCWSTFRDLERRYPYPAPILADCEDLACAYSGWLASRCYKGIYVGLKPGKRVAHAVSGIARGKGTKTTIAIIDPSVWYGMPPTGYDGTKWALVSEE